MFYKSRFVVCLSFAAVQERRRRLDIAVIEQQRQSHSVGRRTFGALQQAATEYQVGRFVRSGSYGIYIQLDLSRILTLSCTVYRSRT